MSLSWLGVMYGRMAFTETKQRLEKTCLRWMTVWINAHYTVENTYGATLSLSFNTGNQRLKSGSESITPFRM